MNRATRLRVAAVGWALVIGACTSSEPAATTLAAPSTTSTSVATTRPIVDPDDFSMDDLANGPPLEWTSVMTSDLVPIEAISLDGTVYLLATSPTEGGLSGWTSTDGFTWDEMGQIVPAGTHLAHAGAVGSQLLIATRPEPGEAPVIYSTSDGQSWAMEEIPFETDNPFALFEIRAIGGNESLTIIAGEEIVDLEAAIGDLLTETALPGADLARSTISTRPRGSDTLFEITGPLGFVFGRATGAELGLTDEEVEWLGRQETNRADLFIKSSGGVWQQGELEDSISVISIESLPSGEIVATGVLGQAGTAMWTSFEGLSWERVPTVTERPFSVFSWKDQLIGPSSSANGVLLISDDPSNWRRSGLQQNFPVTPIWGTSFIGTSESGLLVAVEAFTFPERGPNAEFDPVTLQTDGFTIVATNAGIEVESATGEIQSFFASDPSIDDSTSIDLAEETFTFLAEDGSELITLSYDELWALDEEWDRIRFNVELLHHALAYTEDTSEWWIWNLEDIRPEVHSEFVALTPDNLVVGIGDPDDSSGFEIWTAPLP